MRCNGHRRAELSRATAEDVRRIWPADPPAAAELDGPGDSQQRKPPGRALPEDEGCHRAAISQVFS
jgi:hypothetical protein